MAIDLATVDAYSSNDGVLDLGFPTLVLRKYKIKSDHILSCELTLLVDSNTVLQAMKIELYNVCTMTVTVAFNHPSHAPQLRSLCP